MREIILRIPNRNMKIQTFQVRSAMLFHEKCEAKIGPLVAATR